ncbi:hypothetical protein PIB30_057178 [Stylosanthes scabra]|uniref:Uncharacterized protein n=1 Tax=Stylosanthes scabra TaxID=79078 RepID=A0ABU6QJ26_9FABA|nr:hypothetical protein [Stylosanthes scabra]
MSRLDIYNEEQGLRGSTSGSWIWLLVGARYGACRDPKRKGAIPAQWGSKKVRSSSEPRGKDSTLLEKRVSLLEDVLSTMDERFQRIEHDKETLEAHVLGELDALKESMLQIEEKLENALKLFEEA